MTDNQVGAICAAVVLVAFLCLVGLRIWLDHKETMKSLEQEDTP